MPQNSLAAVGSGEKAFSVHEWGVFTAPRDTEWLNYDMTREWSLLPSSFYRNPLLTRNRSYSYWNLAPALKPVIHIHGDPNEKVEVQITFANGVPAVWWPDASLKPAAAKIGGQLSNSIAFRLSVIKDVSNPSDQNSSPDLRKPRAGKTKSGTEWINVLREVKASKLAVENQQMPALAESTNFLYYDGLLKAKPTPLVERLGKDIRIRMNNSTRFHDLMVIERRSGVLLAASEWHDYQDSKRGGKRNELVIELKRTTPEELTRIKTEFLRRLERAGLNADESAALLAIWDQGLFQSEGMTIFYRMPQDEYNKMLPIRVTPRPDSVVRIGLVLHQRMEPELSSTLNLLIRHLNSNNMQNHDFAVKELSLIGGAALSSLRECVKQSPTAVNACSSLLDKLEEVPNRLLESKSF